MNNSAGCNLPLVSVCSLNEEKMKEVIFQAMNELEEYLTPKEWSLFVFHVLDKDFYLNSIVSVLEDFGGRFLEEEIVEIIFQKLVEMVYFAINSLAKDGKVGSISIDDFTVYARKPFPQEMDDDGIT